MQLVGTHRLKGVTNISAIKILECFPRGFNSDYIFNWRRGQKNGKIRKNASKLYKQIGFPLHFFCQCRDKYVKKKCHAPDFILFFPLHCI